MPSWNSDQYLKFAEERTRPCHDLAGRIFVESARRIVDLGCGPGNSTEVLAKRWPDAEITGIDNAAAMIGTARREQPQHQWIESEIAAWANAEARIFEVVFSNAALQWVPNHETTIPRLLARTAPGGVLAFQVPANFDAPAHSLMRSMASSSAWLGQLPAGRVREWHVHDLSYYYDLLAPHCSRIDAWDTEYLQILPDADSIVEWYRGSGLRPFLDALPTDTARERFTAQYAEGIRELYPPRPDGRVLFPFLRRFVIAHKSHAPSGVTRSLHYR
jgi:trans-aconitate 2-methyltransferase